MALQQVVEGTWEEIAKHACEVDVGQRFRLIPLEGALTEGAEPKKGKMITFGMFPQLKDLTEEDFKRAEWHGEDFEPGWRPSNGFLTQRRKDAENGD